MALPYLLLSLLGLAVARPDERLSTLTRRAASEVPRSNKRGLVHITNPAFHKGLNPALDMKAWTANNTDLTWYYNYMSYQTLTPNVTYEFVPMIWGPGAQKEFVANMTKLKNAGVAIQHAMSYNEPDGNYTDGGSGVTPGEAVEGWMKYMEPLRTQFPGIKLGAPATKGNDAGIAWLNNFTQSCLNCTIDFVPFHWYGDAVNITHHIAQLRANYSQPLWVTEYAPPFRHTTPETLQLFKDMMAFLDGSPDIERYSYWPAYRSAQTPKGWNPDMAMLKDDGTYSKVGGWYLGVSAAPRLMTPFASWFVAVMAVCLWALS
jgi:hypothetical protein